MARLNYMVTLERIRFVRFCVVGSTGVVVNLGIFSLFNDLLLVEALHNDIRFVTANAIGIIISIFTNFLLNDYWTWGDREKRGHAHLVARLVKFYLVSSVAAVVQIGVAWAVRQHIGIADEVTVLMGIAVAVDQVAVLVGIVAATFINYIANHLWTFR